MLTLLRAAATATFFLTGMAMGVPAGAHHAPSGWPYDGECCSARDCFQIEPGDVLWTPQGWSVVATGEVIAFNDTQESGDGHWHRCSVAPHEPSNKTLYHRTNRRRCLYVPEPEG